MSDKHLRNEVPGVWIPGSILHDAGLCNARKILLAEIVALSQTDRGCFASNAHLAGILGLSVSAVRKHVSRLVDDGYVQRNWVENGHAQIRSLVPKLDTPPISSGHTPAQIRATEKTPIKTSNKTDEARPIDLNQVLEAFREMEQEDQAERFWNHYEANGWVQGKNKPIKNWRAAARQWISRSNKWNNERKGFNAEGWTGKGIAGFLRNG